MRQTYDGRQPVSRVRASFKELRRERADAGEVVAEPWKLVRQRRGILGWWLDLTAPPPAAASATLNERERVRRAELSGYVTFAVLALGLLMLPNALQNRPTLISTGVIVLAGILAAWLNRTNHTLTAAVLLVGVLFITIGGAMATSPNLDLVWLPALDFFAVPVVLAGLLISRRAPFAAAVVGTACVVALVALKPRDPGLTAAVAQLGAFHFMLRPILLVAVMALIAWLWAGSVEHAIARADRAEEVAEMEHELAEQKDQLEVGIQDLLETHVRVANGDFSARAHTSQDNLLWQIAVSLNNLLARLGNFAQVDARLQRTEAEIDRLAVSMENARTGRGAIWPAPSGTHVDHLLSQLTAGSAARGMGTGKLGAVPGGLRQGRAAPATAADGTHRAPGAAPGGVPGGASGVASGVWAMSNGMPAQPRPYMGTAPAWPAVTANGQRQPDQRQPDQRQPDMTWGASGVRPYPVAPQRTGRPQPVGWRNMPWNGQSGQQGQAAGAGYTGNSTHIGNTGHAGYVPAHMPPPEPYPGNGARAADTTRSRPARAPWHPALDAAASDTRAPGNGHQGDRRWLAEQHTQSDQGLPASAARQWPDEPLPPLPPSPWPATTQQPWAGTTDWTAEPLPNAREQVSDPAIELTMPQRSAPVPDTAAAGPAGAMTPGRADPEADQGGASGQYAVSSIHGGEVKPLGDADEAWPDWPAILRRWAEQPAAPDPYDHGEETPRAERSE
jgi:hypothetical protein